MKRKISILPIVIFFSCLLFSSCGYHKTAMKTHTVNDSRKFALAKQLPTEKRRDEQTQAQVPAEITHVHKSQVANKPVESQEGQLAKNTTASKNLKVKIESTRYKVQSSNTRQEQNKASLVPFKKISKAHSYDSNGRPWILTIVICFFLGILGIHRFYLGYNAIGLAQFVLFLFMLFFVSVKSTIWDVTFKLTLYHIPVVSAIAFIILFAWVLTDFIRIIMKKLKPKIGHYTT